MNSLFVFATVVAVILAGMLSASAMGIMPSQEQILACQADAQRLCPTYPKDQIAQIQACMEAHKKQLSDQCRGGSK